MSRADKIGIALSGSQKTLMVGLSVAVSFGMSILPLVAFHTCQLVVDAALVERFRRPEIAESD